VLYGGSVNPDNAKALAVVPEVDGLFVGRAAWTAQGLLGIARLAVEARAQLRG
jgi:triosephosphate isomerase